MRAREFDQGSTQDAAVADDVVMEVLMDVCVCRWLSE
jgi:hypothetical protein